MVKLNKILPQIKISLPQKVNLFLPAFLLPVHQESVMMQFCGNKLDKKDFFGKSDPFLVFYRSNEDGTWVRLPSSTLRPLLSPLVSGLVLPCIHRKLVSLICLGSKATLAIKACVPILCGNVRVLCAPAQVRACSFCVCVSIRSGSILLLPPPSDPHPTLQRMTSQIRPCALRAEDTRSTCWAGD